MTQPVLLLAHLLVDSADGRLHTLRDRVELCRARGVDRAGRRPLKLGGDLPKEQRVLADPLDGPYEQREESRRVLGLDLLEPRGHLLVGRPVTHAAHLTHVTHAA